MAQRILRPLSNAGLFDEAFDLYKNHFLLLVGIAAVMSIPASLLSYLFSDSLIVGILMIPLYLLEFAATTWAVSQCYLGNRIGITESYGAVFSRSVSLVMSLILCIMVFYMGLALCFLPGVFLAFWLVFTPPVIVLEQKRYIAAIQRSRELAAGNWGRIFVIGIFLIISCGLLEYLVSIPADFVYSLLDDSMKTSLQLLYDVVDGLFYSMFTAIPAIVLILLYYDVRVREEGFDIEMLARDMSASPEAANT